jgi:hypothetical protein
MDTPAKRVSPTAQLRGGHGCFAKHKKGRLFPALLVRFDGLTTRPLQCIVKFQCLASTIYGDPLLKHATHSAELLNYTAKTHEHSANRSRPLHQTYARSSKEKRSVDENRAKRPCDKQSIGRHYLGLSPAIEQRQIHRSGCLPSSELLLSIAADIETLTIRWTRTLASRRHSPRPSDPGRRKNHLCKGFPNKLRSQT